MLRRLGLERYLPYAVVSAAALALDYALFLLLVDAGMRAGMAAGVGYLAGMGAHWLLSTRFVFAAEVAVDAAAKRQQLMLFLLSGLAGTLVTIGVVGIATALGLAPALAKLLAIVIAFNLVFVIRRHVVFARSPG